jgi:hypothetical protein
VAEETQEKVPEPATVPQVDAQISAMNHQEMAYEEQVTRLLPCGS